MTTLLALFILAQTPQQAPPATPAVAPALEMQIRLDRAGFSPGEIDGRDGANTEKARVAFAKARKLQADDAEGVRKALAGDREPLLIRYTITKEDADGPFADSIPKDLMDQSKLPALHYTSVVELLAERFHASPALLKAINPPDAKFGAGDVVQVPNVHVVAPPAENAPPVPDDRRAARVVVSKSQSTATAFNAAGDVIFHAPVTSGSQHDPLPIGRWEVTAVSWRPTFNYNPDLFWDADPSHAKAKIPPGPNGPVGVVWIDVTKEHYGLHGTPEPGRIGYTSSHGCVRMTNWDATRLGLLVAKGTPVIFES